MGRTTVLTDTTIRCAAAFVVHTPPAGLGIYAEVQNGRVGIATDSSSNNNGSSQKRILWVGAGSTIRGVFADLFQPGNDVIALDIVQPNEKDLIQ